MPYTRNQGIIAEWMNTRDPSARAEMRQALATDPQVVCYVTTGQASHLYDILQENQPPYFAIWMGGGTIGVTGQGLQEPRILQSSQCGITFLTGL